MNTIRGNVARPYYEDEVGEEEMNINDQKFCFEKVIIRGKTVWELKNFDLHHLNIP